jgi:hypothetical protein
MGLGLLGPFCQVNRLLTNNALCTGHRATEESKTDVFRYFDFNKEEEAGKETDAGSRMDSEGDA